MSDLRKHVQQQQDTSCTLCGVIQAIGILDAEGVGQGGAITALIQVAQKLADEINDKLDVINLPEGEAEV